MVGNMASAAAAMPSSVMATLLTKAAKEPGAGAVFLSLRSTLKEESADDRLGLLAGGGAEGFRKAMPFRFKVGRFCAGFGGAGAAVVNAVVVLVGAVVAFFLPPKLTSVVALDAAAFGAPGGGGGLAFGFTIDANFFCLSKISRSLAVNLLLDDDMVDPNAIGKVRIPDLNSFIPNHAGCTEPLMMLENARKPDLRCNLDASFGSLCYLSARFLDMQMMMESLTTTKSRFHVRLVQ